MGKSRIKEVLFKSPCDWIKFEVKVPAASHMSGVWERQIRTARSILSSFLSKNGTQLDVGVWGRSNSQQPRLPTNHLSFRPRLSRTATHQLTMKSKVLLSPPGQLKCTPSNAGDAWNISLTNSSLAGEKSIYSVFRKDSGSGRYLVVIHTSEASWWSKIPTFHIVHGMHAGVQHWWSSPQGSRIPGRCLPGQESEAIWTDALPEETRTETCTSCTIPLVQTTVVSSEQPAVNPELW